MKDHSTIFVNGAWQEATSGRWEDVTSPSSGEIVGRVQLASRDDVDQAVAAARVAFDEGPWPRMTPAERGAILERIADGLEAHGAEIGRLAVEEIGFPVWFGESYMATNPVDNFRNAAQLCQTFPFEEELAGDMNTLVVREPVGVAATIPAFNGPLQLGAQKVAPALAAGCTVVLKAPNPSPLSVYILCDVAAEAGLPPGVLNMFVADVAESEHLVSHPDVDMVSFTGSTDTGSKIGEACGRDIKRVTLELGGKSAAIVLEDADLDVTVPGLVGCSVAMVQGEACVCQSRIVAARPIYDELVERLTEAISQLTVGDPHDPATIIGPMISSAHRDRVERYIALGKQEGATLKVGGDRPEGLDHGFYVNPTLFSDVTNDMRIAQEEIFGPVVVVIPHDGVDDAIAIANDSPFGLAGTVWTTDPEAGLEVARRVRTGTFSINAFSTNPDAPFGGYKKSGLGREWSRYGLEEYTEYKAITLSGAARA
jgi:betaine-aldehyde dehydrogenase